MSSQTAEFSFLTRTDTNLKRAHCWYTLIIAKSIVIAIAQRSLGNVFMSIRTLSLNQETGSEAQRAKSCLILRNNLTELALYN